MIKMRNGCQCKTKLLNHNIKSIHDIEGKNILVKKLTDRKMTKIRLINLK